MFEKASIMTNILFLNFLLVAYLFSPAASFGLNAESSSLHGRIGTTSALNLQSQPSTEIAATSSSTNNRRKMLATMFAIAATDVVRLPALAAEPKKRESLRAKKITPTKEPALGKILGTEKGGQVLPKDNTLNPDVLTTLKVCIGLLFGPSSSIILCDYPCLAPTRALICNVVYVFLLMHTHQQYFLLGYTTEIHLGTNKLKQYQQQAPRVGGSHAIRTSRDLKK